ncbi:hypothetical protein A1O7_00045 [Cladophialophora yegresii CBS 114405]|uniref:Uncharacterized protein n=1 Tax=Cladophialophora yegresii CBS 114405 TaxID=1182544 RepID=W9WFD9_9EURO|nr:uncharacterized protein A1O7_00045 [Cladophialophora yegresii CBS 114405]EXJ63710.1 hypothetical protein A1O7_00045 [Cladophialophora yegresii CBS 114405]
MAEDVSPAPSPGLALDGTADRSAGAPPEPSTSTQPATTTARDGNNPASDPDGDTLMTSAAPAPTPTPTSAANPTRAPNAASDPAGAPPTPDASPKAIPATTTATAGITGPPTEPAGPVPLDSPLRTTPIHPSLPSIKVPESAVASSGGAADINPITLQPFTEAELSKYGFAKLRAQIFAATGTGTTHGSHHGGAVGDREREEIARLRDETAAAVRHRLEERELRVREIEREMEEKEKIREVERKVFRKKLGKDG